jgi:hypothetical protein
LSDLVNHPPHYTFGRYEVIDVIEDWDLGYNLGNAVKYMARSKHKDNELLDLEKAQWYLSRHIENVRSLNEGRADPTDTSSGDLQAKERPAHGSVTSP